MPPVRGTAAARSSTSARSRQAAPGSAARPVPRREARARPLPREPTIPATGAVATGHDPSDWWRSWPPCPTEPRAASAGRPRQALPDDGPRIPTRIRVRYHSTRSSKGQNPSVASIYRALAEHAKREAYPEAVEQVHADFAALAGPEVPDPVRKPRP